MQREEEETWLDSLSGWEPEGNVVETCWSGDPAVDQVRSDLAAYFRTLDRSVLAIWPGMTPVRMLVRLPSPAEWGNIHPFMVAGAAGDQGSQMSASIVAFELCVRFPEVQAAQPHIRQGLPRLPQSFLRGLLMAHASMIVVVGSWIISHYALSGDEKKTSSPASTEKTSGPEGSTSVGTPGASSAAPTAPAGSTAAPTSETVPARSAESSGSGAAAPSTSGGPSTAAPAPTSGGPERGSHG